MTNSIPDMMVRIKNAGKALKASVLIPYSKKNFAIAEVLKKEGYIKDVSIKGKTLSKQIEIILAYENGVHKIREVFIISKFSKRVYEHAKNLKRFKQGFGATILTTPKGILTDKDAKKENVGGELLFKIW